MIILAQAVEPAAAAIKVVLLPIDVVALVSAILSGSAAVMGAFAAAYAVIASIRAQKAVKLSEETRTDIGVINHNVAKLEIATNSLVKKAEDAARAEGVKSATAAGEAKAATLKQGQDEGRAHQQPASSSEALSPKDAPVPVADERTARASERVAAATETSARAQERVAAVAENKSEGT